MIEFKVADAKISAEARKTAGEERRRPISAAAAAAAAAAESRLHAALRTVSLRAGGELEFQR